MTKKAQIPPSGGETDGKPPWLCTCVQTLRTPGSFAASGLLSPRGQIRTEGMPSNPGSVVEKSSWAIISMTYCVLP